MRAPPLLALLLALLPGCFTVVPTHCEGGVCGVRLTPAHRHTPAEIVIGKRGEAPPEDAIFIATLTSPKASQSGCSADVLNAFRGKAALFGFDGIADVEVYDDGGRSACTGRGYIVAPVKP